MTRALQVWSDAFCYSQLMIFTKRLRERVRSGDIECSIRIWKNARVKVGQRYRMEQGHIQVDSIAQISFDDITPALARSSGFAGVVDLLKIAKHGSGNNVYLVRFHYIPPPRTRTRIDRSQLKSSLKENVRSKRMKRSA